MYDSWTCSKVGGCWWEGVTGRRGTKGSKNGATVIASSIKYIKKEKVGISNQWKIYRD